MTEKASLKRNIHVGVFIDLHWNQNGSGHVKCWERLAEAATLFPGRLQMTCHFLGKRDRTVVLSDNVRFRILRPRLGTDRFFFMDQGAGHTDLAPVNRRIIPWLKEYDIIHTTDIFSFGWTVQRYAGRGAGHIVNSIHTDLPAFTRVYSREIIHKLVNNNFVSALLLDRLGLDRRLADRMRRKLDRHLSRCAHIFVSCPEDLNRIREIHPEKKVSYLRRGIDTEMFHPGKRDRKWLNAEFGIPGERPVLLFVGRIDNSKNIMILARAVKHLMEKGIGLHIFLAGNGSKRETVKRLLGNVCTAPGVILQTKLARVYASSDIFVFPSVNEVSPNVVLEAKSSGLPVIVSAHHGGGQFVGKEGLDGIRVETPTVEAWADAISQLVLNPEMRVKMGRASRRHLKKEYPGWPEVLEEDLLPVWSRLADVQKSARVQGKKSS